MKYLFTVTVDLQVDDDGPLDRGELARYIQDAISAWYGKDHPDDWTQDLKDADFTISYTEGGRQKKLLPDGVLVKKLSFPGSKWVE